MEALLGAADAIARRLRPRRARRRVGRARPRARHRVRGALRRRRRGAACSRPHGGTAAIGARVTRTQPLLDRYRGDGETATRDLYDPRLFREEMFLPVVREVGEQLAALDVRAWSLPDPDGRLGARVAKQLGASHRRLGRGVRRARRHRRRGAAARRRSARSTRAGTVAIVGIGGGRTTGVDRSPPTHRCPAPRPSPHALARAAGAPYAEVLRARGQLVAVGRDGPDGRAARERACSSAAPTRCSGCSAAAASTAARSTRRRRSTRTASRAAAPSSSRSPLARRGVVHTFVVNHTMPAPFVAPLPLAVVDLDDGAADHAAGRRRRRRPRDRHRGRAGAAPLRARARRPGLRLQGAGRPSEQHGGSVDELEPGRGRRRRAHQVRRAVRPELRADGRGRVRRRVSTAVDKGFDPSADRRRVRRHPARARSGARRASAATPCPTAIGLAGHRLHPHRERLPVGLRRVPGRRDGRRERRARRRARHRRREDARQVGRGGPARPRRGRATRSSPAARPRRCCSRRSPPGTCTSSARPARCSRRSR